MRVYEFIIDSDREDHISRHGVSAAEVEQVVFGNAFVRRTRQHRFRLVGQTVAGRYLAVFLAARGRGVYALVTARDATEAERRLDRRRRGV